MKRALIIILVLLVALPVAGFVAAQHYLTPDFLRARASAAVLRATGRELTIAGLVRLHWSLQPSVEAEDVSFANPPGMSRPDMAHADRVEARLDPLALLSRRVEVTEIVVSGPDLLLERDAAGRPNWVLTQPPPPPTAAPASAPKPRMPVIVDQVEFQRGRLGWTEAGRRVSLELNHASYAPPQGAVSVSAVLRDVPIELNGSVGPFAPGPVPLQIKVNGAGLAVTVAGTTAQAAVRVQAADLSSASPVAGLAVPPARDLQAQATVALAPATVTIRDLRATMAQGDLAGELTVGLGPHPSLRGALTAQRMNLDGWAAPRPPAPPPVPGPAAPPSPVSAPAPRQVIPDIALPFAALRRADADLHLTAGEALWRGIPFRAVDASLHLQDGRLRLDPLAFQPPGGAVQAQLAADAAASPPSLSVTARAPGLAAGPLLALLGAPEGSGGTADLDVQLAGAGETTRAVVASLDGHAGIATVDGEIDNSWFAALFGDALRRANLPFEPGGRSHVRCAAIRLELTGGQGRFTAFTVDTTRLSLEGTGTIDLAHETLDLHVRPQLRLGAVLSVPVRVTGPLAKLTVTPDVGALAPGRVGILLGGPLPADTCGPALAIARGGQPGAAPAAPAPERRTRPADLLRGLLR